jgi:hypothetical protein
MTERARHLAQKVFPERVRVRQWVLSLPFDLRVRAAFDHGLALARITARAIGSIVLRRDITIAAGTQTLDIDVPSARLRGAITVDGAALPSTGALTTTGFELYLSNRESGQRHRIGDPHYAYIGSGGYELRDATVDAAIVPGTYDLVYERGYWNGSSSSLPYISRVDRVSVFPNANTRLRSCVAIP